MGQSLFDQNTRSMPMAQSRRLKTLLSGVRIPRARVISRNLEPSLVAIRQSDAGIEFEASQTIPSLDVGYAAPVIMAAVLPAVQQVRGAAQRVESQNNLRQQVLAALNYESAHQDFPQGYTVDKQGNKLLSWRVYVLPFIEQNRLFQQFKLDEPWDSPNNKKLIEKMPKTFRSPASNAKPGFTVYRGIGGKSGVLRGADEGGRIGFGNITDGSSNGSTLFMSDQIETISLRYMMKMNDGNIVRSRNLRPTARQRVEEMKKLGPIDQRFVLNQETKVLKLADILSEEDQAKLAEEDQRIKLLNRFRQIAIAMHNFESAYLGFPVAYSVSGAGQGGEPKPLLSWRVHILPYLDQQDLYRQFHLDEAWDSEHNKALVEKMPDVFVVDPNTPNGKTTIVGIGGKHGIIGPPKSKPRGLIGTGFGSISDGSSNTILLIDAGADQAVEWTKPTEFEPTAENLKNIIGKKRGFAMGDASTGYLKDSVTMETLQELLTMDGGEVVADGWRQRD